MNLKPILPVVLALAAALPARAIELSLEENRAERGNIGYIDMGKLFKQFPETLRAKENFEEIVRQTEDQLNVRKVEVLRLRGELSQLRAEREAMAKTIQAPPAPKEKKAASGGARPPPRATPRPCAPPKRRARTASPPRIFRSCPGSEENPRRRRPPAPRPSLRPRRRLRRPRPLPPRRPSPIPSSSTSPA